MGGHLFVRKIKHFYLTLLAIQFGQVCQDQVEGCKLVFMALLFLIAQMPVINVFLNSSFQSVCSRQ